MPETINPEMLILARESRGMTQLALAQAIGVTQACLSKWEAALIDIPESALPKLANALDYPPSFFVQAEVRFGFGSSCFYHRKRQSMPVSDLRRIQAQLNILRIQICHLLRGAEIVQDTEFLRLDIQDNGSPSQVAQMLRSAWALPPGPISNLVAVIERAGGIVIDLDFGSGKIDAVSQMVAGMPPLMFLNRRAPSDRQRFSLAHELGHLVMHRIPTEEREREADEFAAEFLMPANDIRHQLRPLSISKLAALKPYWKASMAAIAMRAANLGAIGDRQYRSLFTQLGKHGYRMTEPVEIPGEQPTVLKDLVRVHLDDHGYSIPELSSLLNINEHELRSIFLPQQEFSLRIVSG